MFSILNKQILAQDIKRIDIHAPDIAQRVQPGQFVMVAPRRTSESIPMAVVDKDERKGAIALIVHEVGPTTRELGALSIREEGHALAGPLGRSATVGKFGVVVLVATGIGAAQILPIGRALKKSGNKVLGIIGAKTKRALMLESQLRVVCDEVTITTNDGSYALKGLATEVLEKFLKRMSIQMVYAIGSVEMMQAVTQMTSPQKIKTLVHLNPVMLSGLGSCGSCRVLVAGQERLACLEGPEFDGHAVDFEHLLVRMNAYKELDECGNLSSSDSPKKKESTIFTRFLPALAKSRA